MEGAASDQVIELLEHARGRYERLVLLVGQSGSGKSEVLQEVIGKTGARYINVNLELSERLLELTARQMALRGAEILREIVNEGNSDIVVLDNIELLFEASLELDSLTCLQKISRNRTIVASWNGTFEGGYLVYAEPGHPEYKKSQVKDLLVVAVGVTHG